MHAANVCDSITGLLGDTENHHPESKGSRGPPVLRSGAAILVQVHAGVQAKLLALLVNARDEANCGSNGRQHEAAQVENIDL